MLDKIKEIWGEYFGKILALSILNFGVFGVMRYILGRYVNYPFYIKGIKFISAFFMCFMFFMLIFSILYFINKKLANIILKIYMLLSYILFMIDFLILEKFRLYISTSTVEILFDTNKDETLEFISSYYDPKILMYLLILVLGIFILSKIKFKIYSKKMAYFLVLLTVVQLGLYKENIKVLQRISFGRAYIGYKDVLNNKKILKELQNKMASNVEIIENKSNIKNIVFIIGESTTRNHMSIYGYDKETNPYLEKLISKGNMFKFNDVISPHGYTMASLKKVLTFYDLESPKEWYEYNNMIDILKAAGYDTYWFSNQDSNGFASNIGRRADVTVFNAILDVKDFETRNGLYDGQIVDKSKDYLKDDKKFVVYHLIGTHSEFTKRYPEEFNKFDKSEYKLDMSDKRKNTIATYDNAILYNDYVINKIINLYKKQDTIIIYISDHAEDLYELGYKGHGEGRLSRYTVEIPMLIYVSDDFKKLHPEIVDEIKASLNKPYMTDDIIHTLLDIARIKTSEYDSKKSLINSDFDAKRPRLLKNKSYEEYYKKQ